MLALWPCQLGYVSNPPPLSLLHFLVDGVPISSLPQVGVLLLRPSDVQDVS